LDVKTNLQTAIEFNKEREKGFNMEKKNLKKDSDRRQEEVIFNNYQLTRLI